MKQTSDFLSNFWSIVQKLWDLRLNFLTIENMQKLMELGNIWK